LIEQAGSLLIFEDKINTFMFIGPLISLFLAYRIKRSLVTHPEVFTKWEKLLTYIMAASGILMLLLVIFQANFFIALLGYGLSGWLFWMVWKEEDFVVSRPLMISLVPLAVAYLIVDSFETILPKFFNSYSQYFEGLEAIGWVWFLATFFMYRRQVKALKTEQELRAKEQKENRINASRKAELEVLVNLRTAELTQQNTKLTKALDELSAAQKQLIHAEKMASLGELTAGIAHEIQNPLNFVNNFSELNAELTEEMLEALKEGDMEEVQLIARDIRENQQKVVLHGKRADSIVKSMLQHSRGSANVKEMISINAIADECIRLSFHGMRAKEKSFNAKMESSFDENVGKIEAIPGDISRVLLNICTNAFYAVMQKSKESVADYHPEVKISTGSANGKVWVKIHDNGGGIPKDNMDKIFQPFFTTKPSGDGTGLGLSLSYEIITKGHGGEIKVDSVEGEGTTFTIELPTTNL
jgi:signal transduction histidine kinase